MAVEVEDSLWRQRFPVAFLTQIAIQKVQEARPTYDRLVKTSLRACLWVNWLHDKVAAEAASVGATSDAMANLHQQFMRGFFDDELDCVVASRNKSSTHQIANLASLPSIQRALSGQSARLSDSETLTKAHEAAEAKLKQLVEAIGADKKKTHSA